MSFNSNNFLTILFALVIASSIASCHSNDKKVSNKKNVSNQLDAEGFVVTPQQFQSDYTAAGSLLPNEEIQILPEISGRVTGIFFKEGTQVHKGQLLVQLYDEDVKAQLQKLKAQKELQQKIKERQAELLRIGGISQQDYETTTTQIQSIDADIAYTEAQLRKTSIIAPFNGTIGIRNISLGAVISPSTVIATLQQVRTLKMDFTLPDQYRGKLTTGKTVYFSVTGRLDTLSGTISAIEPSADPVTRTIKVRAIVSNENHKLVPGAFAHVIIPFESNNDALLVPSQSVIPTTRNKEIAVVKQGRASLVTVTIGTRTNDKVEVLRGLQPGDTVLTTGIMQVKDGMNVKITKIDS